MQVSSLSKGAMKLNFFFDIDGTLLPFGRDVPSSAISAIDRIRKDGHRVFLSTGRSTAEISSKLDVIAIDGGVYSAGAKVIADGRVLYRRVFSDDERTEMFRLIEDLKLEAMIQTDRGTYLTEESGAFFKETMIASVGRAIDIPNCIVADSIPHDIEINKFLFLSRDRRGYEIREALKDRFSVVDNTVGIPQDIMAEVVLKDITKATGIEKVLEYYGDSRDSVVAVGDGANDIEMVEYAALGIAMGNASDELKAVADYVAHRADDDGIADAIEYALSCRP